MWENFQEQKGLTLVEILVSIVLLAIISTALLGFFTQSALFSNKNEQKLGTMATAQKYINLVEDLPKEKFLSFNLSTEVSLTEDQIRNLFDPPLAKSNYNISAKIAIKPNTENLIQFTIIVEDPKDSNNKSITYTYIRK
ncbi:type II secretion system protein [Neobacillus sp. 114]|uniref:PulJ/GspJ family protein n=1 Tax=Neobacillus sp. 114 TaxID=3048535 RepID=UPI0024C41265|nr:type II secretion system protein [Neobacillus sp. 114]